MRKNSLARVAAFAAAALVGGLLPTLGVASASAAVVAPTGVTVSPSPANVAQGGTVTFSGTLAGVSTTDTLTHPILAAITSGPNASPTTPLLGAATTPRAGFSAFTYTDRSTTNVGVDTVVFFFDANDDGNFQPSELHATAAVTVAGAVNAVAVTPLTAHAGANAFQAYSVSASDSAGRPVPGTVLRVSVSEKNADGSAVAAANLDVSATDPGAFPATTVTTLDATTTDGSATGSVAGAATVFVASKVVGTVSVLVSSISEPAATALASLTVESAGVNDATSVVVTPATQNAFTSNTVTESITVLNTQGDPIVGVIPVVTVTGSGPNAGKVFTSTATNLSGVATATSPTLDATAVGTDTVTAFVNQTNHAVNNANLNPGEPSGTASVVVSAIPAGLALTNNAPAPAATKGTPVDVKTAPITYTLANTAGAPVAGFTVNFAFAITAGATTTGKYTLSPVSGLTDANGKITVSLTNATPVALDAVTVTATLAAKTTITSNGFVRWDTRVVAADTVVISPAVDTQPIGGTATHTVKVTDQFGAAVPGPLTFLWAVTGRNNASNNVTTTTNNTGSTFTYTDVGTASASDSVTVTAFSSTGAALATSAAATQFWVAGTAKAAQINIDLDTTTPGIYSATSPFAPSGFQKTATGAVTAATSATAKTVTVRLADANGNPLFGKSVSFTITGVGEFLDTAGTPIGKSTVASVVSPSGYATVFVRSTQSGAQTITASVDGLTDSGVITYTGQYVANTPVRVLDSRFGIGDLTPANTVTPGLLAPSTAYTFFVGNAVVGTDVAAYAFNVTAIHPNKVGNLRIGTGFGVVPTTSLVNYQPGKDVANFVIVPNDNSGFVTIYSENASVAVAIDLVGSYAGPSGSENPGIRTADASRLVDTRTGLGGGGIAPVKGGTHRSFQITGLASIPTGTTSVALNVTAVNPSGLGNLRIYPDGAAVPTTSNINYVVHQDKSAFVVINLPANGKIDVFSDGGSADVAIDPFAFYPVATANVVTATPVRILDTRKTSSLAANVARSIPVVDVNKDGVPADAQAVLVSVTGIHRGTSTGIGNLRVFPTAGALPVVSTLNYVSKTSDVANFAIVKLGTNGEITLYSDGSPIDVAVDVLGYVPAGK